MKKVSDAAFVKAWNRFRTRGEVGSHLGMTPNQIHHRARVLRKAGVALPAKEPSRSGGKVGRVSRAAAPTNETLIKVWNGSSCREEVARKLNFCLGSVASRVQRLRKAGVYLKPMPTGHHVPVRVSDAEFAAAWDASDSIAEVAGRLGVSEGYVGHRRSYCARRGLALKKMYRVKHHATHEQFMQAWANAAAAAQVCIRLGWPVTPKTRGAVCSRASRLRKAGVPLPFLKRGGQRGRHAAP